MSHPLGEFITFQQKPLGNPIKEVGTRLLGRWVCGPGEPRARGRCPPTFISCISFTLFCKQVFSRLKRLSRVTWDEDSSAPLLSVTSLWIAVKLLSFRSTTHCETLASTFRFVVLCSHAEYCLWDGSGTPGPKVEGGSVGGTQIRGAPTWSSWGLTLLTKMFTCSPQLSFAWICSPKNDYKLYDLFKA